MRRIPTLASPIKGHVSIARSDYRKLVRVARAAEEWRKFEYLEEPASVIGDLAYAVDALNAEPKRKRK